MKKKYFYNIDFLRFVFCISILLLHFSSYSVFLIQNRVVELLKLRGFFCLGYICVEFFFIISGFLWCLGADRQISLFEFAKKKIIRFFPLMFFAVICFLICSLFGLTIFETSSNILALSFLSGLGFKHSALVHQLGNINSCWYISVLFWILLFYQYLYNNWQKKWFNLFIVLTIIFGYIVLTNTRNGDLEAIHDTFYGIFNFGLIRGLCAIGIGYLIGEVYKTYYSKIQDIKLGLMGNILLLAINSCALFYIFLSIFYMGLWSHNNDIFFIYCFVIVMLCFVFNKDLLSRSLNNKYFAFMGKYALPIYIMHNLVTDIFKYGVFTLENLETIQAHPYLLFYLAIATSVLVGIIVYYLVEKPATKYLSKYLKKTN